MHTAGQSEYRILLARGYNPLKHLACRPKLSVTWHYRVVTLHIFCCCVAAPVARADFPAVQYESTDKYS